MRFLFALLCRLVRSFVRFGWVVVFFSSSFFFVLLLCSSSVVAAAAAVVVLEGGALALSICGGAEEEERDSPLIPREYRKGRASHGGTAQSAGRGRGTAVQREFAVSGEASGPCRLQLDHRLPGRILSALLP